MPQLVQLGPQVIGQQLTCMNDAKAGHRPGESGAGLRIVICVPGSNCRGRSFTDFALWVRGSSPRTSTACGLATGPDSPLRQAR